MSVPIAPGAPVRKPCLSSASRCWRAWRRLLSRASQCAAHRCPLSRQRNARQLRKRRLSHATHAKRTECVAKSTLEMRGSTGPISPSQQDETAATRDRCASADRELQGGRASEQHHRRCSERLASYRGRRLHRGGLGTKGALDQPQSTVRAVPALRRLVANGRSVRNPVRDPGPCDRVRAYKRLLRDDPCLSEPGLRPCCRVRAGGWNRRASARHRRRRVPRAACARSTGSEGSFVMFVIPAG
ncbi:hypothetical protein BRPE67_ECDS01530 (plasmid) [Caballeronia cordobensis]|nr:hypothetical protein BRPE67_ECDS01530 [Burkholderia sp. RPE67]